MKVNTKGDTTTAKLQNNTILLHLKKLQLCEESTIIISRDFLVISQS